MANLKKKYKNEVDLKEILSIVGDYKWIVLFVMFLSLFISSIYLYFTPSIYSTHSIIEVKNNNKNRATDDLLQNAFYSTNKEIDKEIEILKTFTVNNQVLNKINLKTQIFVKDGHKIVEKYGDENPIKISNVEILDNAIVGEKIELIPRKGGYSLKIVKKAIDAILSKNIITLDSKKIYSYNSIIQTKYFRLNIKRNKRDKKTVYFKLNGDNFSIYENIVNQKLKIKQLNKKAPLIVISYEDTIAKRASAYVNSLVEIFLKNGLERKNKRNQKILNFIEEQLAQTKKKLTSSEDKLRNFKVSNGIVSKSTQADTMISNLSKIDFKISENQLKENLVNNILVVIKNSQSVESVASALSELGDDITANYISSLEKLKIEKERLEEEYTDEYPKLIVIHNQIKSLKKKIIANIENLKKSITNRLNGLEKIKNKYEESLLKLPKEDTNLIKLTRQYEVNSKMYDYLLEKKSENDMIKVATVSDYEVIEKAYPKKQSVKPNRTMIMLSSLIVGLVIGSVMALILNGLQYRIKTIRDIESATSLQINGIIPFYNRWKNYKIWVFDRPQSFFSDNYRKLRTDLNFLYDSGSSKTILITSISNKEGKSTTAVNLSAILQLSGYKVLAIDLDLRNPSLHRYFDIDNNIGVSDYLSGIENISEIVFSTLYPNLDIIVAGSSLANPSELLLSDKIGIMLNKLKDEYDYIIIDSASIGSLMDTLNFMRYTDINLVVFRANKSKKSYINLLETMIDKYNLKNIGIVINGIKAREIKNKIKG
jgi:capsular exopolysaccharide synthesis family protein